MYILNQESKTAF